MSEKKNKSDEIQDEEYKERKKHKHKHKSKDDDDSEHHHHHHHHSSKKKKSKSHDNEIEENKETKSKKEEKEQVKDTATIPSTLEKSKQEQVNEEKLKEKEPEVHTANNWESVDLGDQNRKNKFLKLMGAFKNPDKNAPPIKQRKPAIETDKLNQDLEKQFNEGIQNKFNRQIGLGFSNPSNSLQVNKTDTKPPPPSNTHVTFDD